MSGRIEIVAEAVFADGFLVATLAPDIQPSTAAAFQRALQCERFARDYAAARDPDR